MQAEESVQQQQQQQQRKRVSTAEVFVEVLDLDRLAKQLETLAERHGGFVVNLNRYSQRSLDATIRVHADAFEAVLTALTHNNANVHALQQLRKSTTDITGAYHDAQASVRVLNATRESLMSLLQKATIVSDILQIQAQLTQTNQQLDVLMGQLKRMDADVQYSKIL